MKYIIAPALILLAISCGPSSRKIERSNTVDNSVKTIDDLSKIVTTREIDTSVWTKIDSATSHITPKEIAASKDSVVTKTVKTKDGLTLITSYNKNTNTYSAKAVKDSQQVIGKIKETTTKDNNIHTKVNKDVVTTEVKKDIEKKGNVNWNIVIIGVITVIVIGIVIIAILKLPSFNKK